MTDESGEITDRVMLDIETLGLEPGAAILSIGAVRFDINGLGEEFYRTINLESCQDAGLTIDAGTLEWWLGQDDAVTNVLEGGDDLEDVLEDFAEFYGTAEEIWAFSPSFDCEMLEAAYDAVDIVEPWDYYQERCCRTLVELPQAIDLEQEGDEHHALDDAIYQAKVATGTLAKMQRQEANDV